MMLSSNGLLDSVSSIAFITMTTSFRRWAAGPNICPRAEKGVMVFSYIIYQQTVFHFQCSVRNDIAEKMFGKTITRRKHAFGSVSPRNFNPNFFELYDPANKEFSL